ncbi:MAG: hypothetical protein V8S26_01970 [Lachnospiraceae bacterium]
MKPEREGMPKTDCRENKIRDKMINRAAKGFYRMLLRLTLKIARQVE